MFRAALSARDRRQGRPIIVCDEQRAIDRERLQERHIDPAGLLQFVTDRSYDQKEQRRLQRAAAHRGSILSVR